MPFWRQVITVDHRIRIIKFYPNRNADGLIKRIEKIGHKTVEYYQNRDDKVYSRSVRFVEGDSRQRSSKDYVYVDNYVREVRITKMSIKFEKNPRVPANEQIAKLSIDLLKNQIRAEFHMN